MKKLIFIFFIGISLISCSSDDDANETNDDDLIDIPIDDPSLIGRWNWVSDCGGISYDCSYPSKDHTEDIEFKEDLTYIEKINGEINRESRYLITDTIFYGDIKFYRISFEFGYNHLFHFISDTLSIDAGDYWKNYTRNLE